jgi:hypothetical protein
MLEPLFINRGLPPSAADDDLHADVAAGRDPCPDAGCGAASACAVERGRISAERPRCRPPVFGTGCRGMQLAEEPLGRSRTSLGLLATLQGRHSTANTQRPTLNSQHSATIRGLCALLQGPPTALTLVVVD